MGDVTLLVVGKGVVPAEKVPVFEESGDILAVELSNHPLAGVKHDQALINSRTDRRGRGRSQGIGGAVVVAGHCEDDREFLLDSGFKRSGRSQAQSDPDALW